RPSAAARARAGRVGQTAQRKDRSMPYLVLKWLHVLLAIAAVGTNLTYGIWLAHAARSPQALAFTLRGVKVLDDRVANPAYGLLLVTGLALAYLGGWSFRTPWIMIALTLYVIAIVLGLVAYGPT